MIEILSIEKTKDKDTLLVKILHEGEQLDFIYTPEDDTPIANAVRQLILTGQYEIKPYKAPPFESDRQAKYAELAAKRWEVENGGIVVNGIHIATDDRSKNMITSAAMLAIQDPNFKTKWKSATGYFYDVDATTMTTIAMAVAAHVQACFDNESRLREEISKATTRAALSKIDLNQGWPTY